MDAAGRYAIYFGAAYGQGRIAVCQRIKVKGSAFKEIERDGDRDFWMTAEEAKKYGMIDDVLTRK